ncbi:MAG TPA: hypothetical protein VEL76_34350, partial [Gemmataceae bacterium]|nr:hypothetical protein [Gemmataceae bacterium]
LLKLEAKPCFVRDGIEMREMQLEGWKASEPGRGATVLYKGPFRQVIDDTGAVYRRGERVMVDASAAERLRQEAGGEQVLVLAANGQVKP